ncbi:zinc ABC transporter substrate-binding protein [Anabaena sp. FACHB-1237]|uniref:metal ABC transporter solute-binding protein, Zn/Mn family n=1 Tax=Anabaena sp. FACHB-1237 TaxID=2692769 RepID=UPI0016805BD8|nr:zinc ABC transporter substrate-binding protein [Anabaena sp. FACHB-1237]MBD2137414.1 zinc ABC transporter substrate-binding protein [Anabaena sp. FACHB-1237]
MKLINNSYKLISITLCLPVFLSACTNSTISHSIKTNPTTKVNEQVEVVTTSTILTDLTTAVAGEEVKITGILKPGSDPHVYEPVPADSRTLEKADLILYNGYNLEPGLIKLMNATGGKAKKVAIGEVVRYLELKKPQGEIVPDPHVWGSAENSIKMVEAIKNELIKLAPEDKDKFIQNADKMKNDLQKLHIWISEQIATIPPKNRKLITTHDAFQYYGNAYKIEIAGTLIGISTEEQPSAQTVKKLVDDIKKISIPVIFAETTINPALIKTVAEEAGIKLAENSLYSDSIGAKGSNGDTYIKMMVANTKTIVESLGGKYTPFKIDN